MPDQFGRLTSEDEAKAREWFATHWKSDLICPICGSDQWHTIPHVVTLPRLAGDGLLPGTVTYPQLAVMSVPCGYTLLFNAVVMGIAPAGPPPQESAAGYPELQAPPLG